MVGWHHRLNGHGFGCKVLEIVKDKKGSLAFCSPRGCKESDTTYQLNKELNVCTLPNFMC